MTLNCVLKLFISCLMIFALSACSSFNVPDLQRLYLQPKSNIGEVHRLSRHGQTHNPVILIHGAFGSRLRNKQTGREVWPAQLSSILFGNYQALGLPIDKNTLLPEESELESFAITDRIVGVDFYGRIIDTLKNVGGYHKGEPGNQVTDKDRRFYVFIYDWRQDNVQTARKLDQLIEQIRLDYDEPDLKVDIVAHSMGGLIARYYIRYGRVDVLNDNEFPVNHHGASRVRKVILLGTPNLGSVSALQEFIQGMKVGFRRIPTEVFATMPSAYQLLPHPIRVNMVKSDGLELDRDLFDAYVWERFEWSIFNPQIEERIIRRFENQKDGEAYLSILKQYFQKHIERGRRFVWSLSVTMEKSPIEYIVLGGDCDLTPARILVEEIKGESMVRLFPGEITNRLPGIDYQKLMLEPGDGRVTKPSLLARTELNPLVPRHKYSFFPIDYSILLCESHDSLTGNISLQNNLLNVLLTRDDSAEMR